MQTWSQEDGAGFHEAAEKNPTQKVCKNKSKNLFNSSIILSSILLYKLCPGKIKNIQRKVGEV